MSERSAHPRVRGVRLGGPPSFGSDSRTAEFEPRKRHNYVCMLGHSTTVMFHADAPPPMDWDCSVCPSGAKHETLSTLDDAGRPVAKVGKTHLEQLRSRRTEEELEALLEEALSNYRKHGRAF